MAKYRLMETGRCESGTFCEHCGRFIFRYAYIQGAATRRQYRVGLDCAHTLCGIGQTDARQLSINF